MTGKGRNMGKGGEWVKDLGGGEENGRVNGEGMEG